MRVLFRNAGLTVGTVLALALGIGLNTAVFTAYKAMLARPLDARNASEMVNLALIRESGGADFAFSYPDYEWFRDSARSFSGLIAFSPERMRLSDVGGIRGERASRSESALERLGLMPSASSNTEFASVFAVSENYFKVLGVRLLRGRSFEAMNASELAGAPSVLISENCWEQRFEKDPAILGKTVRLNGVAVTVVGITTRDFVGTSVLVPDFWLPIRLEPVVHANDNWLEDRENRQYHLFGRLASHVSIGQARAEMMAIEEHVRTLHVPGSESSDPATILVWRGSPFPLPLNLYPGLTLTIALIMIAAIMVLVIACANAGSLQFARIRFRQDEFRTRQSLGATRARIVMQLLTESSITGLLAGLAALLLSWAVLSILANLAAGALPAEYGKLVFNVKPDIGIFAYVFFISLLAGILFGIAPAMEGSRFGLTSAVRGATASPGSRRAQDLLISLQVALSLVLMIAGSLFIRSAINALSMDTGYDSRHVVEVDFQFPEGSQFGTARRRASVKAIRTRLAALPEVTEVTSARAPSEELLRTAAASMEAGRSERAQSIVHYSFVEPNYFETLDIPLTLGRAFRPGESEAENSVILSGSAAEQLWPRQNPLGRTVRLGAIDGRSHNQSTLLADGAEYRVVGVARDTRGAELDSSDSKRIYLRLPNDLLMSRPVLVRTHSDAAREVRAIDSAVSSVDAQLVVTSSTLHDVQRRGGPFIVSSLAAAVASVVGSFGLLLAAMGIYGTVSYIVVLRTREIGVRMAIGAQRRDIFKLILGESTRPVLVGLMAGIVLAIGASYLLRHAVYGLNAVDAISFAAVSLLFLVIALIAVYPPSRRATRIDPMLALRYD